MSPLIKFCFRWKLYRMSMKKDIESLIDMSVGGVYFASSITLLDITQLVCGVVDLFLPSFKVELWRHWGQGRLASRISILCAHESPCCWTLIRHGRSLSLHSLRFFTFLTTPIDASLITFLRQVIAFAVILWPLAAKDAWLTVWASKIDLNAIIVQVSEPWLNILK